MKKNNKKNDKTLLKANAFSAVIMIFALAVVSIVYVAMRCQNWIKLLLSDSDTGNFFDFGS